MCALDKQMTEQSNTPFHPEHTSGEESSLNSRECCTLGKPTRDGDKVEVRWVRFGSSTEEVVFLTPIYSWSLSAFS